MQNEALIESIIEAIDMDESNMGWDSIIKEVYKHKKNIINYLGLQILRYNNYKLFRSSFLKVIIQKNPNQKKQQKVQ